MPETTNKKFLSLTGLSHFKEKLLQQIRSEGVGIEYDTTYEPLEEEENEV